MARLASVHHDTLIGPNKVPIARGTSGGWTWHAHVSPGVDRLVVSVRRTGESRTVALESVPNYVLADIVRAVALRD
ncbi:hypothetical protein SEA_MACGULLY_101 [Rhodococcus phage MacGully]|nr:hypothetical protein SEA_MACGULLY_101 [Rhodococcus phage MacGully]